MRAALYARFSSDNQREESILAQFRDSTEYCKKKDYKVVATYADEAKSGTTIVGRDEYNRMLDDAKHGKFDVIVFHKVDRNARNEFDYYMTKHKLQQVGVRYEYSKQDINATTPEGQMMESMLVGMAAYYSRNLANEIKKGLRENVYQGKTTGGIPPYGYKTDKEKHLIIDDREAPAIEMIFRLYNEGFSYIEISEKLLSKGFVSRKNKPFPKTALYEILRNPRYKGTLIIGRTVRRQKRLNLDDFDESTQVFHNAIPAIISKELFDEVQEKMNQKKHRPGENSAKTVYALSGLIKCGMCGNPMQGHSASDRFGKIRYYYRCHKCHAPMILRDTVENIVLDAIKNACLSESSKDRIKKILQEEMKNSDREDPDATIERLNKEYAKTKQKLNRIYDLIEDGTADAFDKERLKETKETLIGLQRSIAEEENRKLVDTNPDRLIEKALAYIKAAMTTKKSHEEIKALFRFLVKEVTVYNEKIVVYFVVTQEGFEPTTHRLEGGCSIQLSY